MPFIIATQNRTVTKPRKLTLTAKEISEKLKNRKDQELRTAKLKNPTLKINLVMSSLFFFFQGRSAI